MNFQQEIKLFTAKLLIVTAVLFVPLAVALVVVNAGMSSISRILAADYADPVTWAATTAARLEAMRPERREAVHHSIVTLVAQLQPFIQDLRPLIPAPDGCAAKPNRNP